MIRVVLEGTPVSPKVAASTVQARRCGSGKHVLNIENAVEATNGSLRCSMCGKQREARRRAKTHTQSRTCQNNHYYSPENTRMRKDGGRQCKQCMADYQKEYGKTYQRPSRKKKAN